MSLSAALVIFLVLTGQISMAKLRLLDVSRRNDRQYGKEEVMLNLSVVGSRAVGPNSHAGRSLGSGDTRLCLEISKKLSLAIRCVSD